MFVLVVTRSVLDRTLSATRLLQTKSFDISEGIRVILTLSETAKNMQVEAKSRHEEWYANALSLAEKVNVGESKRRTCAKQIHRSNQPHESISDFYFKSITKELLNHLSTQIKSRFDSSLIAYQGLAIIPSNLVSLHYKNADWKESFQSFLSFYHDDFPNLKVIEGEMDSWQDFWMNSDRSVLPNSILKTFENTKSIIHCYPTIYIAMQILATLPITSCECERSFSKLRRLKDYCRSTMTEQRLNGLALLYIHHEKSFNIDDVIDEFANLGPRRIEFL